jgi:maleate isomerase
MLGTHTGRTMVHHDNWGWRARLGMFIVGSEAVPEAEWWAMCPPDVSVHAARITAKAPWATWDRVGQSVELADDLIRGARQFAAMQLSAMVVGHSSSSIIGGKGWDEAVVTQLHNIINPPEKVATKTPTKITTNGLDCAAALRSCGLTKPYLVFPPWFGDALVKQGVGYFEDHGFKPAGHLRHDPGPGWRELPPGDLYAHGLGFAQNVEALYAEIVASCPDSADGVFIAGTGFRCVGIIDALEQSLARPVVTANQASLWRCLTLSQVRTHIAGYGALLRDGFGS